jgi:hypothetical protein
MLIRVPGIHRKSVHISVQTTETAAEARGLEDRLKAELKPVLNP